MEVPRRSLQVQDDGMPRRISIAEQEEIVRTTDIRRGYKSFGEKDKRGLIPFTPEDVIARIVPGTGLEKGKGIQLEPLTLQKQGEVPNEGTQQLAPPTPQPQGT